MVNVWTKWAPWGVCSMDPCTAESFSYLPGKERTPDDAQKANPPDVFCVDQPTGSMRRHVYQILESGKRVNVVAKRQRWRSCNKTLNFFKLLFRHPCKHGYRERDCTPCDPIYDPIYRTVNGRQLLPNCSQVPNDMVLTSQGGFNLYAIIGGVVGTVAFTTLLLCFIRFILEEVKSIRDGSGRSRGHRAERHSSDSETAAAGVPLGAGGRISLYANPYYIEMPPAYKDVVPITPPLPGSTEQPPSFDNMQPSEDECEEQPPPSYQEVIATSSAAAQMHHTSNLLLLPNNQSPPPEGAEEPPPTPPPQVGFIVPLQTPDGAAIPTTPAFTEQ